MEQVDRSTVLDGQMLRYSNLARSGYGSNRDRSLHLLFVHCTHR